MEEDIVKKKLDPEEIELVTPPTREDLLITLSETLKDLKRNYNKKQIKNTSTEKLRLENIRLIINCCVNMDKIITSAENSSLYSLLRQLKEDNEANKAQQSEEETEKLNAVLQNLIEVTKNG